MEHKFGGAWTKDKLQRLEKYLKAYRTIFTKNPKAQYFKTWYVDAFAGTGARVPSGKPQPAVDSGLFEDVYEDQEAVEYQNGSARIALSLTEPFDHYLFIDKAKSHIDELKQTISEDYPRLTPRCVYQQGDANEVLKAWCKQRNWSKERAVVFLDPYGMQVEWTTIEALAATKAVDLWYLFPLGVGVARLLTHTGEIEEAWQNRLDLLFGTQEWRTRFYKLETTMDLFGDESETRRRTADTASIGAFIHDRLAKVFAKVAKGKCLEIRGRARCTSFVSPHQTSAEQTLRSGSRKTFCATRAHLKGRDEMATLTTIEWTETTWNPVTGCLKVSQGCKHCYAERMAKRLKAMGAERYRNGFKPTLQDDLIDLPRKWKKPRTIFVNSMSDLFQDAVPDDFIQQVFGTMEHCPQHTFQILTKRSERLRTFGATLNWPRNVWIGVSVEDSRVIDRIHDLAAVPARVRFLSCEPLIGPLENVPLEGIHWVIVGGESGPGARPMRPEWVESIHNQCRAAHVAFFFKQWGGVRKHRAGRELHGRTYDEMPRVASSPKPPQASGFL